MMLKVQARGIEENSYNNIGTLGDKICVCDARPVPYHQLSSSAVPYAPLPGMEFPDSWHLEIAGCGCASAALWLSKLAHLHPIILSICGSFVVQVAQ